MADMPLVGVGILNLGTGTPTFINATATKAAGNDNGQSQESAPTERVPPGQVRTPPGQDNNNNNGGGNNGGGNGGGNDDDPGNSSENRNNKND